jgi:hypothetical protein
MIPPFTVASPGGVADGVVSFRTFAEDSGGTADGSTGPDPWHPAKAKAVPMISKAGRRILCLHNTSERLWAPKGRPCPVHLQHVDSLKCGIDLLPRRKP